MTVGSLRTIPSVARKLPFPDTLGLSGKGKFLAGEWLVVIVRAHLP
ncbi:hypothetical protein [Nostocoides japonicum]|nr:hypothetical protein [Tetrasphaera japonica]